jgi:hypothetical protein
MRKTVMIFYFLLSWVCIYSQTDVEDFCKILKTKGYTQGFCDYNNKYAFKNIPFESNYDSVASKLKLIKQIGNANQYDCKDGDVINWATIRFDNCVFDFSSSNKLDGIQLQLLGNESREKKLEIKEKMQIVKNYLTVYFGKPERLPGSDEPNMWRGSKVYIVISSLQNTSSGLIAIYRTNTNPIDNL